MKIRIPRFVILTIIVLVTVSVLCFYCLSNNSSNKIPKKAKLVKTMINIENGVI